jgi:hypothetical protein
VFQAETESHEVGSDTNFLPIFFLLIKDAQKRGDRFRNISIKGPRLVPRIIKAFMNFLPCVGQFSALATDNYSLRVQGSYSIHYPHVVNDGST